MRDVHCRKTMMHSEQQQRSEEDLEASYKECARLYEQALWLEAQRSSDELVARWIGVPGLTATARGQLANAMWIACYSRDRIARESGTASDVAFQELRDLLAWLRSQPERTFRFTEAWIRCEQMKRYGFRDEALSSLDQAIELVEDLDDLPLTKQVASEVVDRLPKLLHIPPEDQKRYSDALTETLNEDQDDLPDVDELGVPDPLLSRMERTADAMSALAACLEVDDDEQATELRARLLLAELEAVGKLGQTEKLDARHEAFAALGEAALAACDSMVQINEQAVREGNSAAAESVPGFLMMKAGVLMLNDEDDSALVVLTAVIDRFEDDEQPSVVAMVRKAREMQTDLLEDPDEDGL